MDSLDALFCHVDDFCQEFEPHWQQGLLSDGQKKRQRQRSLCLSEIMTILVSFHRQQYRHFKAYYCEHVCKHWRSAFPGLVSYQRFVEWIPSTLLPLCVYLKHCFGTCSGISFIDSTSLKVCNNRRIPSHKVFREIADRGKTSVGWFYGFKLHLVVNDQGELLNMQVTPGNTDDPKYRDTSPALLGRLSLPLDGELQSFEGCSPYRWGQGSRSPPRLFALGLR